MKEAQIQDLFTEINKCEPVLDVDLPDIGAGEMEQAILEGAMNSLREKYIKMFSVSSNCKRPHVNVDKLRNALHQVILLNLTQLSLPYTSRQTCGASGNPTPQSHFRNPTPQSHFRCCCLCTGRKMVCLPHGAALTMSGSLAG